MTTLGEILHQLHDHSEVYQILADSGDIPWIAKLNRIADETKEDPRDIVLRVVGTFTAEADGEAWTKLMGCVQDAPSPAGACLNEMIAWSTKSQSI